MERLTERTENGCAIYRQPTSESKGWKQNRHAVLEKCCQYEDTGLEPEEVEGLKEKQLPMKIEEVHVDEYYCPACGAENGCNDGTVEDKFCPECGQALCQQTGNCFK